jgi:hypothetical protein
MRLRLPAAFAAAVAVAALAAGAGTTAGSADARKGQRLQGFGSCGELLGYAKRQTLRLVGPWGLGGAPPPPPPPGAPMPRAVRKASKPEFSGTNVQEANVDEPDLVKTDGEHLFAVGEGKLQAIAVGARPRYLDSLPLRVGADHELLLHGDRLIVLSRGRQEVFPLRRIGTASYPTKTFLTEVAVGDPTALRVLSRIELDGGYISARLIGSTLRVVLTSQLPRDLGFKAPGASETPAQAASRNRSLVTRSRLRHWLPARVRTDLRKQTRSSRNLVNCRNVRRPAAFSGLGMLTVITADLEGRLEVVDSDAVLADGQTVYSSTSGLYVATQRWSDEPGDSGVSTPLHKFDISEAGRTEYRGSGSVPGFLVNQWALDEHTRAACA